MQHPTSHPGRSEGSPDGRLLPALTAEDSSPSVRLGMTVGVIAFVLLWFPNIYPRFISPNELSRVLLTRAIVEDGTVRLDRQLAGSGVFSDLAEYDGHYYSDKAPGTSFLAVPFYWLWYQAFGSLQEFFAVLLCRLFVVTLPAIGLAWFLLRRWRSPVAVLAMFLGSVVLPQALSFTGHVPMTVLIAIVAELVFEEKPRSRRFYLAMGALTGAAIAIDYTAAIFAVLIAVWLLWKRRAWTFAIGVAAVASLLLVYNAVNFAGPFDLAYHHMVRARDQANRAGALLGAGLPRLDALWGLTFGRVRGLFLLSPFLLACLWRRRDFSLVIAAAYLLATAAIPDWHGGWSLGSRYLVPAIPFLLRGLKQENALFAIGAGWAIPLHVLAMATWPLIPFDRTLRFASVELPAFLARGGVVSISLGSLAGLPDLLSLVIAIGVAAGMYLWMSERRAMVVAGCAVYLAAALWLGATVSPQHQESFRKFAFYLGYTAG